MSAVAPVGHMRTNVPTSVMRATDNVAVHAILPSHRDSAGSLGLACGSRSPLAELGVGPDRVPPAAAFLVQPVDQGGGACDGVADGAPPELRGVAPLDRHRCGGGPGGHLDFYRT